jgi:hypothetical protein
MDFRLVARYGKNGITNAGEDDKGRPVEGEIDGVGCNDGGRADR